MQNKKHIIFDLDGTLTESRTIIDRKLSKQLKSLTEQYDLNSHELKYDIVVISGAQKSQMLQQIPWLEDSEITVMGQSGTQVSKGEKVIWTSCLSIPDIYQILNHIGTYLLVIQNDEIEIRGGLVSLSLIGHNSNKERKKAYDPYGDLRRDILKKCPFESSNLTVKIAGTTCFDYTKNDWGKKGNLETLFQKNDWNLDDAVYVGDQLYEGGNDEDVMEIMDVVSVEGPHDTSDFINQLL